MLKKLFGYFNRKSSCEIDCDEDLFEWEGETLYELTEEEFDYEYMYYMH